MKIEPCTLSTKHSFKKRGAIARGDIIGVANGRLGLVNRSLGIFARFGLIVGGESSCNLRMPSKAILAVGGNS